MTRNITTRKAAHQQAAPQQPRQDHYKLIDAPLQQPRQDHYKLIDAPPRVGVSSSHASPESDPAASARIHAASDGHFAEPEEEAGPEQDDSGQTYDDADLDATRKSTRAPEGSMEREFEDAMEMNDDRGGDREDASGFESAAPVSSIPDDGEAESRSDDRAQAQSSAAHEREHAPSAASGPTPRRTTSAQTSAKKRPEWKPGVAPRRGKRARPTAE